VYCEVELGIKWSRLPPPQGGQLFEGGTGAGPRPWLDDVPNSGQWDAVLVAALGPE
jgi:hypothetical protein